MEKSSTSPFQFKKEINLVSHNVLNTHTILEFDRHNTLFLVQETINLERFDLLKISWSD